MYSRQARRALHASQEGRDWFGTLSAAGLDLAVRGLVERERLTEHSVKGVMGQPSEL